MKSLLHYMSTTIIFLIFITSAAQVGIGTTSPDPVSSLDIAGANSGVLINRVVLSGTNDTTTITSLGALQEGLLVYNTNGSSNVDPETDVVPGFYVWNGIEWQTIAEKKRKKSGWVSLSDGDYTQTLNFVNSPDLVNYSNFVNIDLDFDDDPSDNIIESFAPDGYDNTDFFDDSTHRIIPLTLGDVAILRLQFDAIPNQGNGVVVIQLYIGANDTPADTDTLVIFQKSIPLVRGGGRVTNVSETILLFELNTFLSNGAKIRMAYTRANQTTGNTCELSNFSLVLNRLD